MAEIAGRCRCGKVSYTTAADPVFVGVCHCTSCQKTTGTAFSTVLAVPTAALAVTGTTKRYDTVGDSGQATHRDFCPECGSTVTESADVMAGITMITVGTLDDPGGVKPTMQIYCDSALPWAKIADMQDFAKMPG
jgi:hypothetical protein